MIEPGNPPEKRTDYKDNAENRISYDSMRLSGLCVEAQVHADQDIGNSEVISSRNDKITQFLSNEFGLGGGYAQSFTLRKSQDDKETRGWLMGIEILKDSEQREQIYLVTVVHEDGVKQASDILLSEIETYTSIPVEIVKIIDDTETENEETIQRLEDVIDNCLECTEALNHILIYNSPSISDRIDLLQSAAESMTRDIESVVGKKQTFVIDADIYYALFDGVEGTGFTLNEIKSDQTFTPDAEYSDTRTDERFIIEGQIEGCNYADAIELLELVSSEHEKIDSNPSAALELIRADSPLIKIRNDALGFTYLVGMLDIRTLDIKR